MGPAHRDQENAILEYQEKKKIPQLDSVYISPCKGAAVLAVSMGCGSSSTTVKYSSKSTQQLSAMSPLHSTANVFMIYTNMVVECTEFTLVRVRDVIVEESAEVGLPALHQ